jgi:ribosomal RNA-processing protein 9
LNPNFRSFSPANTHTIEIPGFINALHFLSLPSSSNDSTSWDGTPKATETESEEKFEEKQKLVLVAAVAQEPRLGRWIRLKDGVRNGAFLVHLQVDKQGHADIV